ncbi:Cullin-associated NEDD8-dissociated protein 1, C-terminal part [Yarrowia sp. C11]|nr:Cullin-associated NEDD8-dissociated protein 1, C-terminal part [Yarrowia sp. E02]KAG5367646.1 Cullin-associated NEDD8-dissociated protein 1, C-terminal part [Yarrowia sp. C11]
MTDSSLFIREQLEKIQSFDADLRFMALSDMSSVVSGPDFGAVVATDPRLVDRMLAAVIDKLHDPISEVQNQSVRCLEVLIRQVSEVQVNYVIKTLIDSDSASAGGKKKADAGIESNITCTALKAIVGKLEASSRNARLLARLVIPWMTRPVSASSVDIVDIGIDFVRRFGSSLTADEIATLKTHFVALLTSSEPMIQKRAVLGLSALARYLSTPEFDSLVQYCVGMLSKQPKIVVTLIGSLVSGEPVKFAPYAASTFPLVFNCLQLDLEEDPDEDNAPLLELREVTLYSLEGFLKLPQTIVSTFVEKLVEASRKFIVYDPNFIDDEDDDENMDDEEEEEGDDDEDEFDSYSDDEDQSWKLRRYAAKLADSIVKNCAQTVLPLVYASLYPCILKRLGQERETTVVVALLDTLGSIVVYSGVGGARSRVRRGSDASMRVAENDPIEKLDTTRSKLIQVTAKWLTQQTTAPLAAFVYKSLAQTLEDHVLEVVPVLHNAVIDGKHAQTTLLADALEISRIAVSKSDWSDFTEQYLSQIQDLIQAGLKDTFFKVPVAAIELVMCLLGVNPEFKPREAIEALILDFASSTAIDSEIRVQAISCLGKLNSGEESHVILLRSLENETFRLAAIGAVRDLVARDRVTKGVFACQVVSQLVTLLRQSQRLLRLSALETLKEMSASQVVDAGSADHVISSFLNNGSRDADDLQLVALETDVIANLFALVATNDKLVQPVVELPLNHIHVTSELLADSFVNFYAQITSQRPDLRHVIYEQLLRACESGHKGISTQIIGFVCSGDDQLTNTYISRASGSGDASSESQASDLLILGYIGAVKALPISPELFAPHLAGSDEVIRYAAAVALGNCARANPNFVTYTLSLLNQVTYLALVAIREYIKSSTSDPEPLFSRLFDISEMDDNIQSVASECVGRICVRHEAYVNELKKRLSDPNPVTQAIVLSSLRYIFGQVSSYDDVPDDLLSVPRDLVTLVDNVKQDNIVELSLTCLNAILHNAPTLALHILPALVSTLITHTHVNTELIRQVQMGPFKLKVDDGLSLRKTTYDSVLSLLSNIDAMSLTTTLPSQQLLALFERLLAGLSDEHNIQILSLVCIPKAVSVDISLLGAHIDVGEGTKPAVNVLISTLTGLLNKEVKESAIKQEFEKKNEIQRNVLRCVASITTLLEDSPVQPLTDVELNSWTEFGHFAERFK